MGGATTLPTIAEVAAFLDREAPLVKQAILAQDASLIDLVQPGQPGGLTKFERAELERRAKVVSKALDAAIKESEDKRVYMISRIRRSRILRFVSVSVASLSSATTIITLILGKTLAPIATAALTLLANLFAAFVENIVLAGSSSAAFVSTAQQLSAATRSLVISRDLLTDGGYVEIDDDTLSKLLSEVNGAFSELNTILVKTEFI